jgi:hypothetical protein
MTNSSRDSGIRSGHRTGKPRLAQNKIEITVRLPCGCIMVTLGRDRAVARMKITDDYKAKYRLWAAKPRVVAAPAPPRLPRFTSRRFSSHAEMNEWKRELIRELARSAPTHG